MAITSWDSLWNSLNSKSSPEDTAGLWLAQAASPLVPTSESYKEALNNSINNLNQVIPQYQNMINDVPQTTNQLLGNTQNMFNPLYSNLNQQFGNAQNLFTGASNLLNQQNPSFYNTLQSTIANLQNIPNTSNQALSGAAPIYGGSVGNIANLYSSIMGNIGSYPQSNQMLDETWQQYLDTYGNMQNAQQVTQTGELSPGTEQWMDRLRGSLRSELDTQLEDTYKNDIRGLLANLSERGIVNSDQANRAFTQAADKYLTQKQLGESKINQQIAQAALELPFQQWKVAQEALAAPQTGGQLSELYSRIFSNLTPMYKTALEAAAAPADVTSNYLNQLTNALVSQAQSGQVTGQLAESQYTPTRYATDLAQGLASALAAQGQTQYGGLSNITNTLANMLSQGYNTQQTGYANLLEQFTQMPSQLYGQAFDQYGGMGMLLAKLLMERYLTEEQIAAQKYVADKQANTASEATEAQSDTALWGAIGGLLGNLF